MPVTVEIPSPMRVLTDGQTFVTAEGATVASVLADLAARYPALGAKMFVDGKLRQYINVFVNTEDVRFLDDLDTVVADGDSVELIVAVSGG